MKRKKDAAIIISGLYPFGFFDQVPHPLAARLGNSRSTVLFAYMATILRDNVYSPALILNGVEDHVHLLIKLSRRIAIMEVVQKTKTETSKWLKSQLSNGCDFGWQTGYGAFSVSASSVNEVQKYIYNQVQHHQRMSFQDEFRELCKRHGLELDEQYAWS